MGEEVGPAEGRTWQRIGPHGVNDGDWCPDPANNHAHAWNQVETEHAWCPLCGALGGLVKGVPWKKGQFTNHNNPGTWHRVDALLSQLQAALEERDTARAWVDQYPKRFPGSRVAYVQRAEAAEAQLAKALEERDRKERHLQEMGQQMMDLLGQLEAKAAQYEKVLEELGYTSNGQHIVDFGQNSWGLQHPVECRPNLLGCRINRAMQFVSNPPALGRFRVWLDDSDSIQYSEL